MRNLIPQIIEKKGQKPIGYIADEREYRQRVLDKLFEEVEEFNEAKSIEELADVLEVIDAIYDAYGFTKEQVAQVKEEKKKERGGFTGRYILEKVIEEESVVPGRE